MKSSKLSKEESLRFIEETLIGICRNAHNTKRYVRFIGRFIDRDIGKEIKYEKHHILPKSSKFFPEYSQFSKFPWNMVSLTPREHFIAHILLARALGGRMWAAAKMMADFNGHTISSRMYEEIKNEAAENKSLEMMGVGNFNFGRKTPEDVRKKISESLQGREYPERRGKARGPNKKRVSDEFRKRCSDRVKGERNPMYGKKLTTEQRLQISMRQLGRIYSDETKRKMTAAKLGKRHSDETKRKISKARKEKNIAVGVNNPNSKVIVVYDSSNNRVFKSFGNFKEMCKKYDVPMGLLQKSLYESKPISADGYKIVRGDRAKYIGWRAEYENSKTI